MARREFPGKDNDGKPRSAYIAKIVAMSDEELFKETTHKIWLSAFANNNPRSDFHWHVDAIYDEWGERGKTEQYAKAYEEVRQQLGH